jgi:DNA helicase II / ATP-dependent DNA helicase PcrA
VIELNSEKQRLLDTDGHILALGGPGSGKTFIALLKADRELRAAKLLPGQRILFLSFARATIARVVQQAKTLVLSSESGALEMNTYHGFAWNILRSHGYLLRAGTPLRLLPPPEAASRLAETAVAARPAEKHRLFNEEGLLHFDLFALLASELLAKSKALARIFSDTYPIIILDEFQDTNADEWQLIQTLGKQSRLIALADADQRIYEFRGADPKRIGEFISAFTPASFDFASENNRSNGTDIAIFGNDLLTEANKTRTYKNVSVVKYPLRKGIGFHLSVKVEALRSYKRIHESEKANWSLAVLVPTRQLMLDVSTFLSEEQRFPNGKKLPIIPHEVALESTGPALAAVAIAGLLEGSSTLVETAHRLIVDLCGHMRGRRGSDPVPQGELELVGALGTYIGTGAIRGAKRKLIVDECVRIATERRDLVLSGDPGNDWLTMRDLLAASTAEPIAKLAEDAKYLRLLHKGALLRSRLSELWRTHGNYSAAAASVRDALLQEHFSASTREWKGIHVMTIHKSKGKEFDEVVIYEGSHQGRIVRQNASDKDVAQARLALRVAVTRAMTHVTILTPERDPCKFL